jgi:hypothetical protein
MHQSLFLVAFALFAPHATGSTDDPTEHELHTAQCVAALEARTDELAAQVKSGQVDLQTLLLEQLKYGAALIVDSYTLGERNEERARGLLDAALDAQELLPRSVIVARQSACAQQGAQLLDDADFVGRAVVSRLATRRMKKLLEG